MGEAIAFYVLAAFILGFAVLVITAQNTMANAIEAMKRGAFNYVTKPFDLDEVRALVARAS